MRPRLARSLLQISILCFAADALGYDQQVTSTLWAEGYSVYGREGQVVSRRRFVEDLHLGAWNLITGEDDPYYQGPRLSIEVALRLDADAAMGRSETSPSSDSAYVPGLTPLDLDAMVAHVDARGFWQGTLDVRAGRQIRIDPLGFLAFDGLETRLNLPIGIGVDTYIGFEVLGGQSLGYDALELDGTDSGGRHDMEVNRYPDRSDPESRLAAGTQLVITPWHWLEAGLGFRAVGIGAVSSEISDERVGGHASFNLSPVRSDLRLVYSPLVGRLSEVYAVAGLVPVEAIAVYVEYHRMRPVFEGDSIFNVFDIVDQNDLGGRVVVRLARSLETAVWGFARLEDGSAGIDGGQSDSLVAGAGGGVGANYRTPVRELSTRFSFVQEWGERRIGGELGGKQAFLRSRRLWLGIRVSVWHIDDHLSELFSGDLAGYVASARFRLADWVHVLWELEQYVGQGRESRFYMLALLQMDLWR